MLLMNRCFLSFIKSKNNVTNIKKDTNLCLIYNFYIIQIWNLCQVGQGFTDALVTWHNHKFEQKNFPTLPLVPQSWKLTSLFNPYSVSQLNLI